MKLTPDVFSTAVTEWSRARLEGAVTCRSFQEPALDATTIMLTTQNYSKRVISGLELCRLGSREATINYAHAVMQCDLLRLADQLEKVASQIRAAA